MTYSDLTSLNAALIILDLKEALWTLKHNSALLWFLIRSKRQSHCGLLWKTFLKWHCPTVTSADDSLQFQWKETSLASSLKLAYNNYLHFMHLADNFIQNDFHSLKVLTVLLKYMIGLSQVYLYTVAILYNTDWFKAASQ